MPNPANDKVNIECESSPFSFNYKIYSITGIMVLFGTSNEKYINISTLKAGIYECQVETQNEKMRSKINVL